MLLALEVLLSYQHRVHPLSQGHQVHLQICLQGSWLYYYGIWTMPGWDQAVFGLPLCFCLWRSMEVIPVLNAWGEPQYCPTSGSSPKPATDHIEWRQCSKCTGRHWRARKQGHHSHCLLQSQCWISRCTTTPLSGLSFKIFWKPNNRKWQPRQWSFAIGWMYYAHPSSGECFYLRTLLAAVKAATSFEDLCWVDMVVIHFQLSIRHVSHMDYSRMTMSGGNVCKKRLIWQAVTNSETCLSPFFMIVLHLIPWHYGWSLESTFAMTFDMLFTQKILSMILLRSKCLTMVFTLLTTSSVMATSLSKIGQPCLFLRMIGLQWLEIDWLQNRGLTTLMNRLSWLLNAS